MFPTMAAVQDEREKLARMLRRAETMGAYVVIPVMLGLAAVSEGVVQVLLTEKWLPCVPYMQWLCIANAAVPITSSNLIAIKSSGRSDVYMGLEMVRRVVMLAILAVSIFAFQSVLAIAIGFCISSWLDAVITMMPVKRLLNYGVFAQMADLWKIVISGAVMFVAVQAMNLLPWNSVLLLLAQMVCGVLVYVGVSFLIKVESQSTLTKLITKLLKDKKK